METKIDVSIIMPVYNSEKYLKKAIDSVYNTKLKNFEFIIIDDCSTDNSLSIIKKYKKKYNNIIIIENKKNLGAGSSKNKGLSVAKGEYIGFIDSDDYVGQNYFYNAYKLAKKNNSELVVSDIVIKTDTEEKYNSVVDYSIIKNASNSLSKEVILGNWACASTCTKLFSRNLISELFFSEKNSDDIMFSIPAIFLASKISYCRGNKYYYYQSSNSVSRGFSINKCVENLQCIFEGVDFLFYRNLDLAKIYSSCCLFPYICNTLNTFPLKYYDVFSNNIKTYFDDILKLTLITENRYLSKAPFYNKKNKRILYLISVKNFLTLKQEILDEENLVKLRNKPLPNKNFKPLVTIVIPVYNGENYLEEAINSALSQTYKNIEILVIDDGSKDNTEKICEKYKQKIRYIKKENGGVASALNIAIKEMKGEYFSWLSHDDLYFEDKIEKQVNFLSHLDEKNVILFGNYIFINEYGRNLLNVKIRPKIYRNKPEYLLLRGCINGITLLIPKHAFEVCGEFREDLRCTQDYDMWHRMIEKFKFIQIKEYLSKTRIHSLQDTASNPRANTEGDVLWTRLIEDVSDKRKKEMEGSLYNFYYKMALHLQDSPYINTLNMCIEKCKTLNSKKYEKNAISIKHKKTLIQKLQYSISNFGLIETIKIVIKKILRR